MYSLIFALLFGSMCFAQTHSWAGTSTYYLWACENETIAQHLDAMESANMKTLRIFLLGGTTNDGCPDVGDVEPVTVGVYDDTQLQKVDYLMYVMAERGLKLQIALHDRWSLGCWRSDAYVRKYNLPDIAPFCYDSHFPSEVYLNPQAQQDFRNRIEHMMTHPNPYFHDRPWGDLHEAVFSFEPENESQLRTDILNPTWNCDMSKYIKQFITSENILVTSGGDQSEIDDPLASAACEAIDVLSIHDYDSPQHLSQEIQRFTAAADMYGKRVQVQEFGATGSDHVVRAENMRDWISSITSQGAIPWTQWMLGRPNGPGDFNTFPVPQDIAWNDVLMPASVTESQRVADSPWPEIYSTKSKE